MPSSDRVAVVAETGRVRPDLRLREREGGHRPAGQPGEILLLLLRRAEQLERGGHPDRLRGGEQGGEVAVLAGDLGDGVGIAVLTQPEAAVLRRDLDAEGPDSRSPWITSAGSFPPDRSDRCPPVPAESAPAAP